MASKNQLKHDVPIDEVRQIKFEIMKILSKELAAVKSHQQFDVFNRKLEVIKDILKKL